MSLKKSSLLVLLTLFIVFFTSMSANFWLLNRSNQSLDAVNKEIRVVLSIIDPINHSRTLRVRLMEYMKTLETSQNLQSKDTLDAAKSVIAKADMAFQAYLNAPKLPGENAVADAYRKTYLAYREQGIQPCLTPLKRIINNALMSKLPLLPVWIGNMKLNSIRCWRSMKPMRKRSTKMRKAISALALA